MGKRGQPGPGETHGTARAGQQVLVYSGKHGAGRYVHRAYPAPASPGWTLGSLRPGPATGLSSDVASSGQGGSGAHSFFPVTAFVPPSRLPAAWRPFPRAPGGLRAAHRLAPCCIAGTQHVPAAGSERLPNGLCQAGNLASLFRKRCDWSFTPKHSLRQGPRSGSSLGKEAGARGSWGGVRGAGQARRPVLGAPRCRPPRGMTEPVPWGLRRGGRP